jgi:hypothetical protein
MSNGGIFSYFNGYRLSQALPYFGEAIKYLREKSFASEITYYCRDDWEIRFLVKDVTKDFGKKVIEPWLVEWSKRVRPGNAEVISATYKGYEWMIVNIPLTESEILRVLEYVKVSEGVKKGLIAL